MKLTRFTPIVVFAFLAVALPSLLFAGGKKIAPSAKDAAKALYYTRQLFKYQDSSDISYELARRAMHINPSLPDVGYYYGLYHIVMAGTQQEKEYAAGLMKRYVDAYPDDYDEANAYTLVAGRLLGNYAEAVNVLEKMLVRHPSRTDTYMSLANFYGMMDSTALALNTVRRYEHIEGIDLNTTVTKATILLSSNDTAAAILAVDSLIQSNPSDPESWMLRGELFGMLEQPDSALSCLLYAETLAPYRFRTKMMLADFYRQQGDSVVADAKMTEALATNDLTVDDKTEGLQEFISGLLSNGSDPNRAIPMLDALEQQEPDNQYVLATKVALFGTTGRFDDAIAVLRRMLQLKPNEPDLWGKLMSAYISKGDYDSLPAVYAEATEATGKPDAMLNLYLATGYSMNDKPEKAADVLLGTIHDYMPSYADTLPPQEILDTVSAHKEWNINMGLFLQMLGDQYVSAQDTVRGLRIYDQSLLVEPNNYLTLNNYAYFLALGGKELDKALAMSLKTVNAQPSNSTFLDTYAYILFRKHDYERALMYQKMAIENAKDEQLSADLFEHYGDILFMLGKVDIALENWKKALKLAPNNELLKRKVEYETYFYK